MLGNQCIRRSLSALIGAGVIMFSLAASAAAASRPIPEELRGKFRGTVTGAASEVSGEFTMVLQGERGGFTIAWSGRERIGFQKSPDGKMFRSEAGGRILDGNPAYWARLEGDSLIVYSMRVGFHGGYDIYTYIYTPVEGGIDMLIRQLRSGSEPLESTARLKRYDR